MDAMKISNRLLSDDSAVSPVIGVILMVAITVILAAVIASFVLGMNPGASTTPTASFGAEETGDGALKISLESSAEDIEAGNIEISSGGSSVSWDQAASDDVNGASVITAGSSVTVGDGDDGEAGIGVNTDSDYTVNVVYTGGDGSSTMQTFEG